MLRFVMMCRIEYLLLTKHFEKRSILKLTSFQLIVHERFCLSSGRSAGVITYLSIIVEIPLSIVSAIVM